MTKRNADQVRMPEQGEHYSDFSRVLEDELESDLELRREYEAELAKLRAAAQLDGLRLEKGWTQAQLAERSGTTQPMLSRLFNGDDDRSPTVETLVKIGLALGKRLRIEFVDWQAGESTTPVPPAPRPTSGWAAPTSSAELAAVVNGGWIHPEQFTSAANLEADLLI